jgi:protoheme IX farnesyltransferase
MNFRDYYVLTKPGIIYGNLITTTAGFLLASGNSVDPLLLIQVLLGTGAIIASGCVFNNIIDLDIDKAMLRTKNRPLVRKSVSTKSGFFFALGLGIFGFATLLLFTNTLTVITGLLGFAFYIGVYSFWKRRSIYGTLVGSVSGATPPVAGYLAVATQLDLAAILLFLILVFWQMVHFYAIAIYRIDEYKEARIPVWPIVRGIPATKVQMILFAVLFGVSLPLLHLFNYTGYVYLIVMSLVFFAWFKLILDAFRTAHDRNWARRVFISSQIVLLVFSLLLSVDEFLV